MRSKHPLRVGPYRVDAHLTPFVPFSPLDDDRTEPAGELACAVQVLEEAAAGYAVRPTTVLADLLEFATAGRESAAGSSQAAVFCGDRVVAATRKRTGAPSAGPGTPIRRSARWS
ncbi:hypothetical protein ACFXPV_05195 [Streptomyces sp. NPDC059118]|uniref:hypothetical protein n=1 Tax=unclassified Streptomyces TaxID=2593676 RepID=UPI00368F2D3D